MLDMEGMQSALAVIVFGFGGMGKSTLAASVVQSLDWSSMYFTFCRVAIDEKTPDKTAHIIKLQKYIISKLGGGKPDFQDPLEGRCKIKEALKKKCTLLFIDNVVDKDYLRDLLPQDLQPSDQETKLRIIVTSREKNVAAELKIICKEYEVKGLSEEVSKSLLFETIVQDQVIEDDENRMINEVAAACRGVPLLLSVFGKHLRVERNKDSYQEALDVLREGNLDIYRDEDLGSRLMFVYDKIKDVEVKEAFLDICTYFHGWEWNFVADIVDFLKLEDLRRRTLVSKSGSGEVIVHDILRFMGMKKARLNRFSNYEELSDALEDNDVDVKGISLVSDTHLIAIQSTKLEATHKSLRVLVLGDWVTLDGPPCHRAFRNLRYLRLGDITAFPFKDPSKLDKLTVFVNKSKPGMNLSHLPSSLKRISHEVPSLECDKFAKLPFRNLSSLKSFNVKSQKSVELPPELHLPASMLDLDLSRCKNVPKYIGHLTTLESLVLDRSDLKCLPGGFSKLKKLKHLSMDYCSKLAVLSVELGNVSSLEELSMKGCGNLRTLPESLGSLLALQTLDLEESINLRLLPESFGQLRINKLELRWLVSLQELPNSFGNMPLLKDLSLESCHSLISLPDSFVQLKMLETLSIIECTKVRILPEDFGRLRYLKVMTVKSCHLLNGLPPGFGALPALKNLRLSWCDRFVNFSRDFTELTCLEELRLQCLPLISRIPDGFGKLKRLRILYLINCFQLKTLSDDFENMATLERLLILNCLELEGAMTERILKLQNCSLADIRGSLKLLETWEKMQNEIEHQIMVFSGEDRMDRKVEERLIMAALLNGKCVEVNSSGQLMERSSLLVGLEDGTGATVALVLLPVIIRPFELQSHQHQIQRFMEMASERAKTNGSGTLQIVCARKFEWPIERPTPTEEEEKAEEEHICQILLSMPKGSCALSKCVKIFPRDPLYYENDYDYHDKLEFFIGHVVVDMEGRKSFENFEVVQDDEDEDEDVVMKPSASEDEDVVTEHPPFEDEDVVMESPPLEDEDEDVSETDGNSIQNFIESICDECVEGESKTREFIETLKGNGIDYLLIEGQQLMVDDLHGKTIGFIICHFTLFEYIKLQQISKDLQQKDTNFIAIWIPTVRYGRLQDVGGHGSYTRPTQCRPWATFPHHLVNVHYGRRQFVVLDKGGQIANQDAMPLLLAWGAKFYPFTQHSIRESFFLTESESCLEFLLNGMDIVGRKPMKSKMTFLYLQYTGWWETKKMFKMISKIEELTKVNGNFEVLNVAKFYNAMEKYDDIENLKRGYEVATQNMPWLSLSLSDVIMFWYRCHYLASKKGYELNKESNTMMEKLVELAKKLLDCEEAEYSMLVLVDKNGAVTCRACDVVQMIWKSSDQIDGEVMAMVKDELIESLSRGECSPLVKAYFRDEIYDLPQHPQHRIEYAMYDMGEFKCDVCGVCDVRYRWDDEEGNHRRSYRCEECNWDLCGNCAMAYAKQQVEQLLF